MSVPAVQASAVEPAAAQPVEKAGVVERVVRAVADAIFSAFRSLFVYLGWIKEAPPPPPPSPPKPTEAVLILDQLKARTLYPDRIVPLFEQHVPLEERQKTLEALGRKVELSWNDWLFFQTQKSGEVVAAKCRDLGMASALKDPYQLAPVLEAALQKKT